MRDNSWIVGQPYLNLTGLREGCRLSGRKHISGLPTIRPSGFRNRRVTGVTRSGRQTSHKMTSGQSSADNIRCGRLLPGTVWYKRSASRLARRHRSALLQLRILQLGLFKDGDVRVRVFPELKKLQVGVARLGLVSCQHVGAAKLEPRQSTQRGIHCDATVVQEFLELRCCFRALM